MKKFLIYLCFLPSMLTGQSLFLTEAIPVSEEGTGMRAPRIALLENNRPVVYWGKTGSSPILYLSIWEDWKFSDPIALNTNGIEPDLWGGGLGPQIAAQGQLIFLVFENYGQGIYCIKSSDGGQSFSLPVTVFDPPPGRVATLPSVGIDPQGNPVVSFVTTDNNEQNAQYEITKSTDGGLSFPPTIVANTAASGGEVCECCPASIGVVTENEMYLGFRNNDDSKRDIWVAKSIDGGANFNEATDIDDTDWFTQTCPQSGPDMIIGEDSIFSVFFSGVLGQDIYFSSMTKETMQAGHQFQFPTMSGNDLNQNYPAIAGNGDTIAVVWQETGNLGLDIIMAWSVNSSADLQTNMMVIEDTILSQRQADIVFQNGLFHLVYEDQLTEKVMYRIASFQEVVETSAISNPRFSVNISPNPFSNKTTISLENTNHEIVRASLFMENGQLVNAFETNGEILEINSGDLGKGVYFLRVQKGEGLTVRKIIKE